MSHGYSKILFQLTVVPLELAKDSKVTVLLNIQEGAFGTVSDNGSLCTNKEWLVPTSFIYQSTPTLDGWVVSEL